MASIQDLINDPLIAKPNPIQMGFQPLPTDRIGQLASRAPPTPMTPQFVQAAADRNAQGNAMQNAWNSGKAGIDSIGNVIGAALNPVSAPLAAPPQSVAPPVATTAPGTRTATQGAPAPGSQGSIEQLGGMAGATPAAPASSISRLADGTMRSDPGTVAAYNTQQGTQGSGITASRQANGNLAFTNVGADGTVNPVTKPQSFNGQGWNLGADNARAMASQDAWNDHVAKGQIADLVNELGRTTPGTPRASALTGQIAQLSSVQNANVDATSKAGLQTAQGTLATAQGNLANTQAQAETQKLSLSTASAKQLSGLQTQFISETDPGKAQALQEKILTLMGKDPKENAFQIVTQDELNDPNNPLLGSHKVAAIVNSKTGVAQSINDALTNGIGGKPSGGSVPLPNHVAALKANPKLADQFDATYGKGAAKKVLGG